MSAITALRKNGSLEIESTILWAFYRDLLDQSERGHYAQAAEILSRVRSESSNDPNLESIRRLISFRISMKSGNGTDLSEVALPSGHTLDWLVPESCFVNGLLDFHLGRFEEGSRKFREAEEAFLGLKKFDRAALSAYNALIGISYHRGPEPSLPQWMSSDLQELDRILSIARNCAEDSSESSLSIRSRRVIGMVLRQKATLLGLQKSFNEALVPCLESLRIFEELGPQSDREISLLLLAFFHHELGQSDEARRFHLKVKPPFDERVAFPHAMVGWLLGEAIPGLENFQILTPEWKQWFQEREKRTLGPPLPGKILRWESSQRALRVEFNGKSSLVPIKAKSKEGRLIQTLIGRKATRQLLCELLWPEQQDVLSLENRLHQLMHRVNQKIEKLVIHDGVSYSLNFELYRFE